MEAANRGAQEAGGLSVGLGIELRFEQGLNDWVDVDINFRYFVARKTMFVKYAQAFVMLAGESARWTSCSRALTLVQIRKVTRFQVVLIGTAYWSGLVDWLRGTLLPSGKIKSTDLRLFTVTRLRRGGRRRHLRRPLATRRTQSTDNRVVLAAAATAPMFVADRSAMALHGSSSLGRCMLGRFSGDSRVQDLGCPGVRDSAAVIDVLGKAGVRVPELVGCCS